MALPGYQQSSGRDYAAVLTEYSNASTTLENTQLPELSSVATTAVVPSAAKFCETVLKLVFKQMITMPSSIEPETLSQFLIDKLKTIQPADMPIPYASRDFPHEVFNVFPEDVFPSDFDIVTHLQLLKLFRQLRLKISSADGLFGLYNNQAQGDMSKAFYGASQTYGKGTFYSLISEARWRVYVARAVERYTKWFSTQPAETFDTRPHFTDGVPVSINWGNLPPLDVLMVWHTHMLHPRAYWEDCVRTGRQGFHAASFPWLAISHAIKYAQSSGPEILYSPPAEAIKKFQSQTGFEFDNESSTVQKFIKCPNCRIKEIQVEFAAAFGHGYAEDKFEIYCPDCGTQINRDMLAGMHFLNDFRDLNARGIPMKGTLLDYLGGDDRERFSYPGFANAFLGKMFSMKSLSLSTGEGLSTIRNKLKNMALDTASLTANKFMNPLHKDNQFPLRRMLVRYDANSGPFGVDLINGVIRQTRFTDLIEALGYISSPFRKTTVNRSIDRLLKFLYLLRSGNKVLSPSIDIDLAWHTFQLSPTSYLSASFVITGSFIDHDDSVGNAATQEGYKSAEKQFKKLFASDPVGYDGCTCVFCESERQFTSKSPGVPGKKLFSKINPIESKKRNSKIDEFYGLAVTAAQNSGDRDVVRLHPRPLTVATSGLSGPQHPYVAFSPASDPTVGNIFKHSTAVEYQLTPCITLPSVPPPSQPFSQSFMYAVDVSQTMV
ncbi:hypothetical protein V1514DRAFT_349795 [Lipomyces japonicus]|uniref:uncharacterized protein n=1 Tax=Lipomyces japonicus TaxID=56871 RepID=UPI0034CEED5D